MGSGDDDDGATRHARPITTGPSAAGGAFRNNVAVVIGIDAYANGLPALRSAKSDAVAIAERLASLHGYADPFLLVDGQATRAALIELLHTTLPAKVGPDDRVIVYFAGHGTASESNDRPRGFVIPQDARLDAEDTYLAMDELLLALAQLPCRHLLLVLDCCFAGALRWSSTRAAGIRLTRVYAEHFERFQREKAWRALVSTAHDQLAQDLPGGLGARADDGTHSPFALALLAALAEDDADRFGGGRAALQRSDGVITLTELYAYLEGVLAASTGLGGQRPGLFDLRKDADKGEYFFLVPGREIALEPSPRENPYRGPAPFEVAHADRFFGRAAETRALVSAVTRDGASPLTVLVGPSGAGKTSLIHAGLVAALAKRTDAVRVLGPLLPSPSPLALLDALPLPAGASLAARVTAQLAAEPTRLVLIVDALDTLITLAPAAEQHAFLVALADALDAGGGRLRVVLSVRSAHEPAFWSSPLGRFWRAGRVPLAPLAHDDLRAAIVGPAWELCLDFASDDLVERVVLELSYLAGALPALSLALAEVYDAYVDRGGVDRVLTGDDLRKVGGAVGPLVRRIEAIFLAQSADAQATTRRVLLRLVGRSAPRSELDYADDAENARVATALTTLLDARVLVDDRLAWGATEDAIDWSAPVDPLYTLASDTLPRAWPRLATWVADEQEMLLVRQRLTQAAREWKAGKGGLWDGDPRLSLVLNEQQLRAAKGDLWLNRFEGELIAASTEQRRRAHDARVAFLRDQGRAALFNDQPVDAAASLLEALREDDPSPVTRVLLRRALAPILAHQARFPTDDDSAPSSPAITAFSPDGARLAVAQPDGSVELWDLTTRSRVGALPAQPEPIGDLVFDPSGARLVSSSPQGPRVVWDATTNALVHRFDDELTRRDSPGSEWITTAVFASGGTRVVLLWTTDFTLGLYWSMATFDATTFAPIPPKDRSLQQGSLPGQIVAVSPDGSKVAVAPWSFKDQSLAIWSTIDGVTIATIHFELDVGILHASFSPDGEQIAITTRGGLEVWPTSGKPSALFPRRLIDGAHRSVISPDGDRVCAINRTRGADVLDAHTGERIAVLDGHESAITTLTWSPDGRRVLTAAQTDVRLWDAFTGDLLTSLRGHDVPVVFADFSPDQRWIVTRDSEGRSTLWTGHPRSAPTVLRDDPRRTHFKNGPVLTLEAASADGGELLFSTGTLGLTEEREHQRWDAREGRLLARTVAADAPLDPSATLHPIAPATPIDRARLPVTIPDDAGDVLASSPSGVVVIRARNGRRAEIYGVPPARDGRVPTLRGHAADLETAMFTADGSMILTTAADGTARLWETATASAIFAFTSALPIRAARFLPGDEHVLTLHEEHVAMRWDFSPDRRSLAAIVDALASAAIPVEASRGTPSSRGLRPAEEDDPAATYDAARAMLVTGWARRRERAFAEARLAQAQALFHSLGDTAGEAEALLTLRAIALLAGDKVRVTTLSTDAFARIHALVADAPGREAACRLAALASDALLDRDAAQASYEAILALDPGHFDARLGLIEVSLATAPLAHVATALQQLDSSADDPSSSPAATRVRALALRWAVRTLLGQADPHAQLARSLWTTYGDPNLPGPPSERLDFRGTRAVLLKRPSLVPSLRDKALAVLALLERPGTHDDALKRLLALPKGEDFVGP